ncbi:MAG: hypothetical protein WBB01_11445 [Phormidesmis sp.]
MLTLEMAIQKIQQFPPEQRNKVIEFVEFLDFQSNRLKTANSATNAHQNQDFFKLAGLWEDKSITAESIRTEAWGENNQ